MGEDDSKHAPEDGEANEHSAFGPQDAEIV